MDTIREGEGSSEEQHHPTGCNLMHSYVLDPTVDWIHEPRDFSQLKWSYTRSKAAQREFRRYQYSSLMGLLLPGTWLFVDLVYPVFFFPRERLEEPFIILFLCIGVVWLFLVPMQIFAHVKRSGHPFWVKVQMSSDALLLLNFTLSSGYFYFDYTYNTCGTEDDTAIGLFGRTRAEYGATPERIELYCRQCLHSLVGTTLLMVPATMNLHPIALFVYFIVRFCYDVAARPIAYAAGKYDPVEHWAQLFTKGMVLVYWCIAGWTIYWLRSRTMQEQFRQTVVMMADIQTAKKKEEHVDLLLCATVPASALARLANNELTIRDSTSSATVLFSDMARFTAWSSSRSPDQVIRMLNIMTESIDQEALVLRVEKVKTIGDAYWAVTGLPDEMEDHALVMCHFGVAMLSVVKLKSEKHASEWGTIQFRVGIHSGPLHGGILGTKTISYEVFGETSDVASRVEQMGTPSRVCVSAATLECAGLDEDSHPEQQHLLGPSCRYKGKMHLLSPLHIGSRGAAQGSLSASAANGEDNNSKSSRSSSHMGEQGDILNGTGRNRRRAFLKQRAAAQAKKLESRVMSPDSSRESVTAEAIRERYSRLKWRWLLSTFADPQVEADFTRFALHTQRKMRFWTRVFILVLPVMVFIGCGIEQAVDDAPPLPAPMVIFVLCSFVCASIDLTLLLVTQASTKLSQEKEEGTFTTSSGSSTEWPKAQAILHHMTSILLLLGLMLSTPGGSVIVNDPSWVSTTLFLLNLLGNCGGVVGALWLMLGNIFLIWPFMWAADWRSLNYGGQRQADVLVLVNVGILLAVFERQVRVQFLEAHLQQFFKREQLSRIAEQEALLKSIVPEHISGALLTWMSGDMKVPLVRNYNQSAVAFLHLGSLDLQPPPSSTSSRGGDEVKSLVRSNSSSRDDLSQEKDQAENPLQTPQLQVECMEDLPETAQVTEGTQEERERETALPHQGQEPMLAAGGWLGDAITRVDDTLQFYSRVSKVKTIGDVVMLAGPFKREDPDPTESGAFQSVLDVSTSEEDVRATILEMVQLSQSLAAQFFAGGGKVSAGIHVGPLVGAIQGTTRLCFDVFGDTVNVASRVMTGCADMDERPSFESHATPGAATTGGKVPPATHQASFCAVSDAAHQVIMSETGGDQFHFAGCRVPAKGKGLIQVYLVAPK